MFFKCPRTRIYLKNFNILYLYFCHKNQYKIYSNLYSFLVTFCTLKHPTIVQYIKISAIWQD